MSNFLGFPLNKYLTFIGSNKVLDKSSGIVKTLDKVFPVSDFTSISSSGLPILPSQPTEAVVKKEVEVVTGIDGKKIELSLATSDGTISSSRGFLVEVYLSGSDGTLTRVYKEDLVDVLNDETLSDGFSSYFRLEVDK